jgi:cell division protein ZapA
MSGIMVMDELAELQKRVKGMESEILTLRKTRDDARCAQRPGAADGRFGAEAGGAEGVESALE